MTVFRLTDAATSEREHPAYWPQRVANGWRTPYHGVWKGDEADAREQADEEILATIGGLVVGLDEPVRILDAACGYGRLADRIAAMCDDYVGVDIVEQQILEAQTRAPENAAFYVGDIGSWWPPAWIPFEFSLVVAVGIWSSIESRSAEVITHLRALLAPAGMIAVFERDGYLVLW